MKKSTILRVPIERLNPDGTGYAVVDGRTLSVMNAFPGDIADVRIVSVKRHSVKVRLESLVEEGVKRTIVECPHFGICGGCKWQDIPYNEQCRMKSDIVRSVIGNIQGIAPVEIDDVIPSPDMFFYRNKMEFSFGKPAEGSENVILGLHQRGRFDSIVPISQCLLQSEYSNTIVEMTRNFAERNGLSPYGVKSHKGLLRYLVIRDGKMTGQVMVTIVTSGEEFQGADTYAENLCNELPHVTTVIHSINSGTGSVALGEERRVLFGEGTIYEKIENITFAISPDAFLQPNPHQAKNLYSTIKSFCSLTGTERLLDLYCGIGTIGMFCAGNVSYVTGIEANSDAIDDARRNARENNINNIMFIAGKVEDILNESLGTFDVVVCDPPRAGIHPKVMEKLIQLRIPRLVYASCNVTIIPRDLEIFALAGYKIKAVRPFDMAPHTPHIETVILLEI